MDIFYSIEDESLTEDLIKHYEKLLRETDDKNVFCDHYGFYREYERYLFIHENKIIVMIYHNYNLEEILINDKFRDFINTWR